MIENDKEESWEAISHKVSTLVEDSIGSLTERLTELEHTVQSQRTTPVTEDDVLNMETWSTLEQVIWSELGKVREQAQEVPNLYIVCEELNKNQKSQEKQLAGLRSFARRVEQFLTQMRPGAVAPRDSQETPALRRGEPSESLGYVPGASASSSAVSTSLLQTPTPPTVPAPPILLYSQKKMLHYLLAETAPHVSARCGVMFALVRSGSTLQISSNGQPEM